MIEFLFNNIDLFIFFYYLLNFYLIYIFYSNILYLILFIIKKV